MIAIVVLLVGIALATLSFRTAIVESRPRTGRGTCTEFIRRSNSPELPVVLLEDLGALLGLVFALVAVTIAAVTQRIWDGIGSLVIGLLLGIIAIVLAVEMKSLLMGGGEAVRSPHHVAATTRALRVRSPLVRRFDAAGGPVCAPADASPPDDHRSRAGAGATVTREPIRTFTNPIRATRRVPFAVWQTTACGSSSRRSADTYGRNVSRPS